MTKQTAVQWLIEKLNQPQYPEDIPKFINNALELEKQQIADAYESGQQETANGYYIRLGEQFYNRNYDKTN